MADKAILTVVQWGCQLTVSDRIDEVVVLTQSEHSMKLQALILTT